MRCGFFLVFVKCEEDESKVFEVGRGVRSFVFVWVVFLNMNENEGFLRYSFVMFLKIFGLV